MKKSTNERADLNTLLVWDKQRNFLDKIKKPIYYYVFFSIIHSINDMKQRVTIKILPYGSDKYVGQIKMYPSIIIINSMEIDWNINKASSQMCNDLYEHVKYYNTDKKYQTKLLSLYIHVVFPCTVYYIRLNHSSVCVFLCEQWFMYALFL